MSSGASPCADSAPESRALVEQERRLGDEVSVPFGFVWLHERDVRLPSRFRRTDCAVVEQPFRGFLAGGARERVPTTTV